MLSPSSEEPVRFLFLTPSKPSVLLLGVGLERNKKKSRIKKNCPMVVKKLNWPLTTLANQKRKNPDSQDHDDLIHSIR